MLKPKKILVIDDERAILRGFVLAFEELPYQLDTAVSGKEGLARIAREAYDLVFLDLAMPDMNGLEVLRGIRGHSKTMPVYLITGYYREFSKRLKQAEAEGLEFDLVQKPFGPERVLMIAESVLEGPRKMCEADSRFVFKLFVAGQSVRAADLARKLKQLLAKCLPEQHDFETVDILANPEAAEFYNIFATPTLLKLEPVPARSIVGDLGNRAKVKKWMTSMGC